MTSRHDPQNRYFRRCASAWFSFHLTSLLIFGTAWIAPEAAAEEAFSESTQSARETEDASAADALLPEEDPESASPANKSLQSAGLREAEGRENFQDPPPKESRQNEPPLKTQWESGSGQSVQGQEQVSPAAPPKGSTISAIRFTGLTRTKDSYLQRRYRRYIGRPATEENLHDLESGLQAEGVFESVELSLAALPGGGTAVLAAVQEKLTFIPLPFAMYSSSGFSAGGIVMDTNAFGVRDTFMVGGYYSSTALLGMAMFDIPARDDYFPGASLFISVSKNTPEINNIEDKTVLEYKNMSVRGDLKVSEKISENESLYLGLAFNYLRADSEQNPEEYIGTARIGGIVMGWNHRESDWNGWFNSKTEATLQITGTKYFGLGSDPLLSENTLNSLGYFQKEYPFITPRLRLIGRVAANYLWKGKNHAAHVSEYLDRKAVGLSILPAYFRTDKIIGVLGGVEFALSKFKYGMLSIYGNYELAWTRDFSLESEDSAQMDEFCHGPSGGMRFYLAKISFPALSFGVSYNIPKDYFQFSVAVGISR